MLIQDLLQRRNSKRSTAQHIWSMQSEDFCSSVARYRRAAAGTSATPRRRRCRGHSTPTVCCVAKFGSFLSLLTSCNEDQSSPNNKRTYLLTEIVLQNRKDLFVSRCGDLDFSKLFLVNKIRVEILLLKY